MYESVEVLAHSFQVPPYLALYLVDASGSQRMRAGQKHEVTSQSSDGFQARTDDRVQLIALCMPGDFLQNRIIIELLMPMPEILPYETRNQICENLKSSYIADA